MFRRKEENADSINDSSAPASNGAHEGAASSASSVSSAPQQPAAAQPQQAAPSYAPTASAAARNSSEPARPVASAAAYRPTPIADFNRSAATARSSEPSRPTAASQPAASLDRSSEKSSASAAKPNRRVLTVGNDILLKGEIATCDRLVIEGRVEAKLSEVHTVEIAECGSFKGTAEVEDAEISGVFEGDLIVRNRIVIYATGEVRGNISYGEIEIERGGRLTGQIKTVTSAGKGKATHEAETKARKETVAA